MRVLRAKDELADVQLHLVHIRYTLDVELSDTVNQKGDEEYTKASVIRSCKIPPTQLY